VRAWLPPVVFGVVFLALWEMFVRVQGIQPYLLPRPTAIADEFSGNTGLIWGAVRVTGVNALVGLVGGVVLGLAVAFLGNRFRLLGDLVTPLTGVVAAMPIIVLVAIFNNLFAITSQVPRRLMVLVAVFFIVFVNVSKGLRQANPTQVELLRSYGAGPSAVLRKVKLPNALAYLFTALRQAAPVAVVTAFVAEYFGGPQDGLGTRIAQSISNSKQAAGWAYVLGACLLGLAFYLAALVGERVAMPWQARRAGRS
jgi:NitT/TauT family transport system permease protein